MTSIVIDRLSEEDFRRSIENRLRESRASVAIERLRALLEPYAGRGKILPERFLTVQTSDFVLTGWDALGDSIRRHDRPDSPVTAISIAFGWRGEEPCERDADGRLKPHVETRYFTDAAFPFSESTREDLLEGYSWYGCSWGDDCEAVDTALSLDGIDDLHAALAELEEVLLASENPDEEGVRAGSLGSCLLSAMLFQAVTEQIEHHGLPRPLCVTSGSSGVYPYFDAPVVGMPDDARRAALDKDDTASQGAPALRYSSLLMTGIPRARKRAVLVLEESEDEMASRIARLRNTGSEGGAVEPIPGEANSPGTASETIEPAAPGASPLLVKKPHGKARDDHEQAVPPASLSEHQAPAPVRLGAQEWLDGLSARPVEVEGKWAAWELAIPVSPTQPASQADIERAETCQPGLLAGMRPMGDNAPAVASARPVSRRWFDLRGAAAAASATVARLAAFFRQRRLGPSSPRRRFPPR